MGGGTHIVGSPSSISSSGMQDQVGERGEVVLAEEKRKHEHKEREFNGV